MAGSLERKAKINYRFGEKTSVVDVKQVYDGDFYLRLSSRGETTRVDQQITLYSVYSRTNKTIDFPLIVERTHAPSIPTKFTFNPNFGGLWTLDSVGQQVTFNQDSVAPWYDAGYRLSLINPNTPAGYPLTKVTASIVGGATQSSVLATDSILLQVSGRILVDFIKSPAPREWGVAIRKLRIDIDGAALGSLIIPDPVSYADVGGDSVVAGCIPGGAVFGQRSKTDDVWWGWGDSNGHMMVSRRYDSISMESPRFEQITISDKFKLGAFNYTYDSATKSFIPGSGLGMPDFVHYRRLMTLTANISLPGPSGQYPFGYYFVGCGLLTKIISTGSTKLINDEILLLPAATFPLPGTRDNYILHFAVQGVEIPIPENSWVNLAGYAFSADTDSTALFNIQPSYRIPRNLGARSTPPQSWGYPEKLNDGSTMFAFHLNDIGIATDGLLCDPWAECGRIRVEGISDAYPVAYDMTETLINDKVLIAYSGGLDKYAIVNVHSSGVLSGYGSRLFCILDMPFLAGDQVHSSAGLSYIVVSDVQRYTYFDENSLPGSGFYCWAKGVRNRTDAIMFNCPPPYEVINQGHYNGGEFRRPRKITELNPDLYVGRSVSLFVHPKYSHLWPQMWGNHRVVVSAEPNENL